MRGEPLDDAVRLLYVAMTRATSRLVLSAHGRSTVVERIGACVADVSREFTGLDDSRQ